MPFIPTRALKGTMMANQPHVRPIDDPFSGEQLHAVAAAKPDVADIPRILGRCGRQHPGTGGRNPTMSTSPSPRPPTPSSSPSRRSSRHKEIIRRPTLTYIPHHWVDAVVEVPPVLIPATATRSTSRISPALNEYLDAARDPDGFRAWLDATCTTRRIMPSLSEPRHVARARWRGSDVEHGMKPAPTRSTS